METPKVICGWCKKVLREGPDQLVSHGICEECEKKLREEAQ